VVRGPHHRTGCVVACKRLLLVMYLCRPATYCGTDRTTQPAPPSFLRRSPTLRNSIFPKNPLTPNTVSHPVCPMAKPASPAKGRGKNGGARLSCPSELTSRSLEGIAPCSSWAPVNRYAFLMVKCFPRTPSFPLQSLRTGLNPFLHFTQWKFSYPER